MFMVCEPPRPQVGQAPHPKSKRSRRRARKHAPKLPRDARDRQRVLHRRGLTDDQERAYFARWPSSAYPGLLMPHRELMRLPRGPELVRYWRKLHERWQEVRRRLMRRTAHTPEDRQIVWKFSLYYRDMRAYELRRCGWSPADDRVWAWWCGLPLAARMAFVDMAQRDPALRFEQRRIRRECRRSAA
jgi:hypothetical protein